MVSEVKEKIIPANYGDTAAEYAAVRGGGAGLIDLSSRGRILVSGSEAVLFLNGLITNDLKTLSENSWMPAAFPNVQGRLLAAVRLIHRSDGFLIDTESPTHTAVLKLVERFTLAGDFRVTDISDHTATFSVQGQSAEQVIRDTLGDAAASIERQRATSAKLSDSSEVTVIRATHTAEDGFDLFVDADNAAALWKALIAAGARPVGLEALEILRIEAGIPRFGVDMDETNVVTEANLDEAVSFTKGCYVGQEIIARIKYRGHVAKKLTGLLFDKTTDEVRSAPGAEVHSLEGRVIGRITSATFSPHRGGMVALAYVKYDYLAPGTRVKTAMAGDEATAEVAELSFVRGSWYQKAPA
jgi:folate-binding protein YgfZ